MKGSDFRKELLKLMPGYKWTVRASICSDNLLVAEGTQSSGSNRLSTLRVERRGNYAASGKPLYEAKSAGYGKKAPWMYTAVGRTLAQALRQLQDHYKARAMDYRSLECALESGRRVEVKRG